MVPEPQTPPPETPGQTLLDLTAGSGAPVPPAPRTASTRVLAQEASGPKIGRYRVLKEHARGGMGRVLLAVDTTIGRKVALKELLSGLRASAAESAATKSIGERFLREARVTGRLEHPSIVPVYEIGTGEDGNLFYSMRFVAGRTLAQHLDEIRARNQPEREKLAARLQLLEAFYDICNAVAYAHSKGVIHRDLKPSNVMLGEFGETVVLDWGLARVLDEPDAPLIRDAQAESSPDSSQLTLDGAVVGTPSYMPPEQAQGDQKNVDQLSDVYALGAVLYEILTGQAPFAGGSAHAILQRVVNEAPRPVLELAPQAPRELAVLCARAMERERSNRLPAALELAQEIKAFRDGRNLSSYEYSSLELLQRFLKRQWKLVAVIAFSLLATGVIGALAMNEIVRQRNAAEDALALATSAEARRQAAERDAKRKAQELLASRESAILRANEALAGYNAEPLLRDLFLRVEGYAKAAASPRRLNNEERQRNRALITAVLGYAAQLQELIRLRSSGGQAPDARLPELQRIQAALVELAIADADFELATYLLSGSNLPEDTLSQLTQRSEQSRREILAWRAGHILGCLDDARQGLRREGRSGDAPSLAQYIAMLGEFQDEQTIEMLAAELKQFQARLGVLGRAPHVIEYDLAELLCGALARLQKPHRVIGPLSEFLRAQTHPRLAAAALNALADLQHADATLCMQEEAQRRGLRFFEANREVFARAYLPPDWAHGRPEAAGFFLYARAEYERARALLSGSASPAARMFGALALLALNRRDEALQQLGDLCRQRPDELQFMFALSRAQDEVAAEKTLDAAVGFTTDSPDALFERAAFLTERGTDRALFDADELVKRWPENPDCWYLKGELLRRLGRGDECLKAYERTIELDPDYALAWVFKAEMLRTLGRPFLEAARRAVELSPRGSHALAYLCQAYFLGREYDKAIEVGKRAAELRPDEQEAWYYVALSYLRIRADGSEGAGIINARAGQPAERRNMEEALNAFEGLLRVNRHDYRSLVLAGECLASLGRDAQAREMLSRAEDRAVLDAEVLGIPSTYLHRVVALLDGRAARVAAPASASELLTSAFIEAFEAGQEPDLQLLRKGLRAALAHLEQGEKLMGDAPSRDMKLLARRARTEIALWLRRGGMFDLIPEVLRPALAGEPQWLTLSHEHDIAEALIALGLQYRSGAVLFLGRDEADLERLENALDSLTGRERKQQGERLISDGLELLRSVCARGLKVSGEDLSPLLAPLREDARLQAALAAWSETAASPHPYAVLVIKSVRRMMQAEKLGLQNGDVIHSVEGTPVATVAQLRAALAQVAGHESYELVVHRYTRDAGGRLKPRLDAQGKPVCDERGNPCFEFTELRFAAKPGTLGVNLVEGSKPHPLDE